jgi:hypothetical protein
MAPVWSKEMEVSPQVYNSPALPTEYALTSGTVGRSAAKPCGWVEHGLQSDSVRSVGRGGQSGRGTCRGCRGQASRTTDDELVDTTD